METRNHHDKDFDNMDRRKLQQRGIIARHGDKLKAMARAHQGIRPDALDALPDPHATGERPDPIPLIDASTEQPSRRPSMEHDEFSDRFGPTENVQALHDDGTVTLLETEAEAAAFVTARVKEHMSVTKRFDGVMGEDETKAIDRLYGYMAEHNVKPIQLERAAGLSNGYLSVQRKRRADMGEGILQRVLHAVPDLDPSWLLTGEGSMLRQQITVSEDEEAEGAPYYDVDFACGFDEVFSDRTSVPQGHVVGMLGKADVFCNVTGDSMFPRIYSGDCIGLRHTHLSNIQYGEIYAVVLDDIRTVKILRRGSSPEVLRFVPINTTDFDEQEFPISSIQRIFKVVSVSRRA